METSAVPLKKYIFYLLFFFLICKYESVRKYVVKDAKLVNEQLPMPALAKFG